MTTKIILTRHGYVEGIKPPRFRGREDIPLSGLGVAQAKATAIRIAASCEPIAVYTSPMGRCISTGSAIAEACNAPVKVLATLNDLYYGAWQWKTHEEIAKDFPEDYATWRTRPQCFRFPQGESLQELVARAADALRWVLWQHHDLTVVLVGHDSVNRALLTQILDQPLSAYWRLIFEPCGISEIDFADGVPWVLCLNDTSHLTGVTEVA
ncbi:MAG: histidine phosphatase family protein [Rhodomicrobium sp.]